MVTPPVLPHHVAYLLRTGPYKNAGSAFKKLCTLAPNTKLFGIYYDDPDTVSHLLHGARDVRGIYNRYLRKS